MNIPNTLSTQRASSAIFRVGLTGGIGSGKSAAAQILEKLGAKIIDLDQIAHEITQPGGLAMPAIRQHFGPDFVLANGALDRNKMRAEILKNSASKEKLEAITHPLIHEIANDRSKDLSPNDRRPYIVFVVPLLIESKQWLGQEPPKIDYLVVVDCPEEQQIKRVQQRNGLDEPTIQAIMSKQATRNERLSKADFVIKNDGDLAHLETQTNALHQRILADLTRN